MAEKKIILYIDDEFINLKLFEVHLSTKYHVLTADNGIDGLKLMDSFPNIKVVVSDMKMPRMNGVEFINKAKEKHPESVYFIMTGYEISNEIKMAVDSGLILGYFSKPFNMTEISSKIENALKNPKEAKAR